MLFANVRSSATIRLSKLGNLVKRKTLFSNLTLLIGSILLLTGQATVFAATPTATKTTTNNANTLKVSPVRSDITVAKGTSTKVQTFITNLTASPIVVQPIENDFVAGSKEDGTPAIILDQNSYAPTHSLKRFMIPLQNVTVPGNDSKEVDVTITVPPTAQPGGYFGAVRFAPSSGNGTQSVNLSASVASLILMTVPGPTTEQLNLTDFDVQQDGSTGAHFRTPNDLSLFLRFQNKGNLLYKESFNQNDPKDEVLPDSARKWTEPLKGLGKFGKYTIGATFTYGGQKQQSIDITKTIWIIPSTYIIGGIIAVIVLILIIVGIVLFLRSYKRRILKSNYRRR
jgi:hypothetical protein